MMSFITAALLICLFPVQPLAFDAADLRAHGGALYGEDLISGEYAELAPAHVEEYCQVTEGPAAELIVEILRDGGECAFIGDEPGMTSGNFYCRRLVEPSR